ncbi:unnamed protein product [Allacma fusca]|uniref:Peroxisomal targeting signal 1 receptor n=1 Tax=Allacma fusca TaxID=39272 RepID=A0A8J2LJI4_9HEXA|nr:unnamed protein product [Allacma fusca]
MSFREFLDSECGQLNPVLKVASHFTQDVSLRDTLASGPSGGLAGSSRTAHQNDPYLQDYLERSHQEVAMLPPTTFQMDSLLREIQSMENSQGSRPIPGPGVADFAKQPDWAQEFLKNEHSLKVTGAAWAGDYFAAELDPVWDNSRDAYALPVQPPLPMPVHDVVHPMPLPVGQLDPNLTARELLDDSKWADDFVATEKTELMSTADELLQSVADPTLKATDFMKFVEKLSTGEVDFADQATAKPDLANIWASEYQSDLNPEITNPKEWAEEFAAGGFMGAPSGMQDDKEDFWLKLQEEWDRLAQDDSANHPWLTDNSPQLDQPYTFNQENPFEQVEDPLSEGKKKLLEGDIPSAVLLFESAVQKLPENPECWLLLGTTQAQNEQDPLAISALNKCLSIQPDNLPALMALAASLTNESYHLQASNALKRWLKFNPKYSHIIEEEVQTLESRTTSILPSDELSQVQHLYMKAARMNPTKGIDPDVQSGLANGGKSAEAIGAYRKSLEISPGCIRTRYNLGISCVNLGAYKEAAEHFLTSLNIQAAGKSGEEPSSSVGVTTGNKRSVMSDSIWSSLRMILHLLDRGELTSAIDHRDLETLNREFQISV